MQTLKVMADTIEYEHKTVVLACDDQLQEACKKLEAEGWVVRPGEPPTMTYHLMRQKTPEAGLPVFDPASLPPIESITAASNISAFLGPGVPEEMTRAALRRAWATDPTIRDFVGLAENQWDFTKPDGVPGFGALELTPQLRRMVARLVGDAAAETETLLDAAQTDEARIAPDEEHADAIPAAAPRAGEGATGTPPPVSSEPHKADETAAAAWRVSGDASDPALPGQTEGLPTMSRRRHGGAVPRT